MDGGLIRWGVAIAGGGAGFVIQQKFDPISGLLTNLGLTFKLGGISIVQVLVGGLLCLFGWRLVKQEGLARGFVGGALIGYGLGHVFAGFNIANPLASVVTP